ncbi:MAG TPA: CsgG/HfaB family protein [Marinagarivorans sp.]
MKRLLCCLLPIALAGCASHPAQVKDAESPVSQAAQLAAQEAVAAAKPVQLALKRKIAVGRISNETTYGRSLLRSGEDELGNKVTDMFVQALINSGNYLIFERPDIALLQQEQRLTGKPINLVGVDTLVIGSLTEFGRSTTGESGFLSSSKKQEATAKVDLRMVDTDTGQAFESVTGSGASSTQSATTMGFGSVASYDGSINDQGIGADVNAAVEKLTQRMLDKPWQADILAQENGLLYISGGKRQGVKEGMVFNIVTKGRKVKSSTTGAMVTLPGKAVGKLKITGTFGNSDLDEGALGDIVQGSISGLELSALQVEEVTP